MPTFMIFEGKPPKIKKLKTIKKELLLLAFSKYKKYANSLNDIESDNAYEEWKKACEQAFPHDKRNYREYDLLKEMLRTLRYKDNYTVIRVYQALGYIVE